MGWTENTKSIMKKLGVLVVGMFALGTLCTGCILQGKVNSEGAYVGVSWADLRERFKRDQDKLDEEMAMEEQAFIEEMQAGEGK